MRYGHRLRKVCIVINDDSDKHNLVAGHGGVRPTFTVRLGFLTAFMYCGSCGKEILFALSDLCCIATARRMSYLSTVPWYHIGTRC